MNEMLFVTGVLPAGDRRRVLPFLKPREDCLEDKGAGKRERLALLSLAGHLFRWQASQSAPVPCLPQEKE